jgi:glucokinase
MLIAGDIGGTKTDLAIYSIASGPRTPLAQARVRSADYSSLQALVAEFLDDVDLCVDVGSFAVAGPVIAGHVTTTNLPWVMDERALAGDLNLRTARGPLSTPRPTPTIQARCAGPRSICSSRSLRAKPAICA